MDEPRYVDERSSDEFCPACGDDYPCTCPQLTEVEVQDGDLVDEEGEVEVSRGGAEARR